MNADRRRFLKTTAAALAGAAADCGSPPPDWTRLRLVVAKGAAAFGSAWLDDVLGLLGRAIAGGGPVPVVAELDAPGELDVLLTVRSRPESAAGAFRIGREGGRIVVAGSDEEGVRNGLYSLLERVGFAFFRDGETVPLLRGPAHLDLEPEDLERIPAFSLRGDMIWNNYLGPSRYCSAMWSYREWERVLVYLARDRMNFLELYPPLEAILAAVFPEARGLAEGRVWKSRVELDLAKRVVARGRALGVRFMYVLAYGAFPEPIREQFPRLEWRNGFLCAHQPELREMTERVWRRLVDELGTDHWYAIRHRGEEDQTYGDPCRSVTKKDGYLQAFSVLERVDPSARVTVWTWGESLPDLFEGFPDNVRAAHIRHGMAGVFGKRGEGREQRDGAPPLAPGRKWLSGQFTVFGGNETLLQTAWSGAASLERDASVSSRDPACEGYFQWPEWSDTSPWLTHVIARISWDPESLGDLDSSVSRFARDRHGERAKAFTRGFLPLLRAGNARLSYPPRKRLLVPWFCAQESLALLTEAREGARVMAEALDSAPALFHRDFLDLVTWISRRQAETFEAEAYVRHLEGDAAGSDAALALAEEAWSSLQSLLTEVPALSIAASARQLSRGGELSARLEDSLFDLGCDFYHGYPLVLSPEAIELVYLPQLTALRTRLESASRSGTKASLAEPGWFWHDFPDPKWADAVRRLPSEDPARFEKEMRRRLREALALAPATAEAVRLDVAATRPRVARLLARALPSSRSALPAIPPAKD